LLEIPENAVSLAEYKRKNLLNKDRLNQEAHVDTTKNSSVAGQKGGYNGNKQSKKEKPFKVNNKRDNQVEENLNELISKKIIQSTQQRDNYGYESRNRDDFKAANDRRRNDFNGEKRDYNDAENPNRNYVRNNNNNSYSNRNYAESNQEGNFSREQNATDNYGSRRGRGGNFNSNRNPLRNVIYKFSIKIFKYYFQ